MKNEFGLSKIFELWVNEKRLAKSRNDWTYYIWFLREVKKALGQSYAKFTNPEWIALFDNIFKTISCELKESIIKSTMPKKKEITQMDDAELLTAYKTGEKWLLVNAQVSGTQKSESGGEYNDKAWQVGLGRLEKLADEMQKRGIAE